MNSVFVNTVITKYSIYEYLIDLKLKLFGGCNGVHKYRKSNNAVLLFYDSFYKKVSF